MTGTVGPAAPLRKMKYSIRRKPIYRILPGKNHLTRNCQKILGKLLITTKSNICTSALDACTIMSYRTMAKHYRLLNNEYLMANFHP